MRAVPVALVLAATLVLGATAHATSAGTTLKVVYDTTLDAKIVVDGTGVALYAFDADPRGGTACSDRFCSSHSAPLLGPVKAGSGVSASLVGTFKRSDGKLQVTYNGHALYYFRGAASSPADRKPGQLNGQGYITAFWVLNPRGRPIRHL